MFQWWWAAWCCAAASWGRHTVTLTCYHYHTDELFFCLYATSVLTFSLHNVVQSINTHGDNAAAQLLNDSLIASSNGSVSHSLEFHTVKQLTWKTHSEWIQSERLSMLMQLLTEFVVFFLLSPSPLLHTPPSICVTLLALTCLASSPQTHSQSYCVTRWWSV